MPAWEGKAGSRPKQAASHRQEGERRENWSRQPDPQTARVSHSSNPREALALTVGCHAVLTFAYEISGSGAYLGAWTIHFYLDAMETGMADDIGHIGQFVLALNLRSDLAQLLLQCVFRPVRVEDAARVSSVILK